MASITELNTTELDTARSLLLPAAINTLLDSMRSTDSKVAAESAIAVLEFYGYRRKSDPVMQANFQQNTLQLPAGVFSEIAKGMGRLAGTPTSLSEDEGDEK